MFHTQEKRECLLTEAIPCVREDAWLGVAYYFWYDEQDAISWGINSKRKTGYYEIYAADINLEKTLDTVFNEEHYLFWIRQIEKIAKRLTVAKKEVTLKSINDYFFDKGIWSQFSGILFQDISTNNNTYLVKGFQYKKRIQLAVYDVLIISNFAHHFTGKCV